MADETEQQLREKIASQKASIANLHTLRSIVEETGIASPETKARAQLIKEVSDNEDRLELLLESKRIAAVVRLQDELHPPADCEDCPICLDTIKHVNPKTICRTGCCGGWICKQCDNARYKDAKEGLGDRYHGKCPLCRGKIASCNEEIRSMVLEHANNGRAWAQADMARWYLNGMNGFADRGKGLQFIKLAADQRYADALLQMAMAYNRGEISADKCDPEALCMTALAYEGEILDRDESKYVYYLKEAADLGHQGAQGTLGLAYNRQKEDKMSLHYITLAASQGDPKACGTLGSYFLNAECGLSKSLILAKYYSEKSLEDDEEYEPLFVCNFSLALLHLGLERYERILEIPGYSPIPEFLFWAQKALEGDSIADHTIALISGIENYAKSHCTNCKKKEEGSSLKRCVRCFGAWYCGKECQVQHWKAGHKIDCIKRK